MITLKDLLFQQQQHLYRICIGFYHLQVLPCAVPEETLFQLNGF